ncbi:MAG: hypothetical protein MUF29_06185 [Chitinophagaceae bacterium]|jgi:hypothetical protein|nr:hypothetical protein [Chitinophagaceae bacterium]
MCNSAKSVWYFGLYILVLGLTLVVTPNLLLTLVNLPVTAEVWIRVVGMLLIFLSVYYLYFARHPHPAFFRLTVYNRAAVILFFLVFVLLELAAPVLLMFAVVDLAGATWTWVALKGEES